MSEEWEEVYGPKNWTTDLRITPMLIIHSRNGFVIFLFSRQTNACHKWTWYCPDSSQSLLISVAEHESANPKVCHFLPHGDSDLSSFHARDKMGNNSRASTKHIIFSYSGVSFLSPNSL